MTLYLGLMSGTSMDSIDAALLEIGPLRMQVRAAAARPWPAELQLRLRRAAEDSERLGLTEFGELDTAVGREFAQAAEQLLHSAGVTAAAVRAIGSHGQTVLHRPRGKAPFTLQLGDPNLIAERLGIDVVADFRRRDIAAGGEGAPLMPAFHAAAFGSAGETRAVINIGGMANVTLLAADDSVIGFDTGPGNCLLDSWARRHLGQSYDANGAWAAAGTVDATLLERLLAEPYFARPPPKSTGRETFSDAWLQLALAGRSPAPVDVQATLAELTAVTIARALRSADGAEPQCVYLCGGGAFNGELLRRIGRALPKARVTTTAEYGIAAEHVEAAGFAWLAHRYLTGQPGNLPAVTGARHPVPLGALYRGRTL
ncbi:MAG TPA: anhydro-N-acetylmuramic acid kinase [Steroidobacteraceae bacterium]|nr:anhydro-N-acetylmuramic acid kinase [Steroidobacteraceae bacterium]